MSYKKRSNQEWVDELGGKQGREDQLIAYEELSRYLFTVAINELILRRNTNNYLNSVEHSLLEGLASDAVQETLEKIAKDNHALLHQYKMQGKFTSYVASIIHRQIGQELRKSYWQKKQALPQISEDSEDDAFEQIQADNLFYKSSNAPDDLALNKEVKKKIDDCLDQLIERRRIAFVACAFEGALAKEVALSLGTSANAVYRLVFDARNQLKSCLEGQGITHDIFD